MKCFMSLFAAMCLLALAAIPAKATPIGDPFLRGMESPGQLAEMIQASLNTDSSGQSIINPERCRQDGSCASALDYLVMIQQSDPSANLATLADLVPFLHSLREERAPSGQYWMACLKNEHGVRVPVLHCISRVFAAGEMAWVDPTSGRIVLAENCTNPVEKPVLQACAEVDFYTQEPLLEGPRDYEEPGDYIVRFALLGPEPPMPNDDCIGVQRAGENVTERWWTDECEEAGCDFSADANHWNQPVQLMGSYRTTEGWNRLFLPEYVAASGSKYIVVLCLEETNGAHSDAVGVFPENYRVGPYGDTAAVVWYAPKYVPAIYPHDLSWTWGEWEQSQH